MHRRTVLQSLAASGFVGRVEAFVKWMPPEVLAQILESLVPQQGEIRLLEVLHGAPRILGQEKFDNTGPEEDQGYSVLIEESGILDCIEIRNQKGEIRLTLWPNPLSVTRGGPAVLSFHVEIGDPT